ncbi:hypothetical protein Poli38472_009882 [Pythium oligandrum]|uniref:Uncharacterized protein n=1 Tax=Pythium oligandrum TaxID=41045 RepID=A0A8K1CG32_PYTOL|nr:hypothetical protein Poli38472_009882 [Pythium oligandrum]|eukprot:TMW62389.1 hypothetical protein Poli38472_009882 [Pythium oligandrum]
MRSFRSRRTRQTTLLLVSIHVWLWTLSLAVLETRHVQRDPWTLHDPDFPVQIQVAPFGDEQWNATLSEELVDTTGRLHIPSSVLNISISLPSIANITSAEVSITLFRQRPQTKATERDLLREDSDNPNDFQVMADTQVQYAKYYRMDIGAKAEEMVLRVYIVGRAGEGASEHQMRAFYIRPLHLSPSEPYLADCSESSTNPVIEMRLASHPPTSMPMDLCREYTMNGRIPVRKWYFDDQTDKERSYEERSFEFIEELIRSAELRKRYYYGVTDDYLYAALEVYPVTGKHVLIIGSTTPWYESICVAMKAATCTTLDYNKLNYHHPKITTYTVAEFEASESRKQFDAIFSISSLEHDGLGRYGDPLDPEADFKAMKGLLKYAKPRQNIPNEDTTKVFLAVPVGPDALVWNAQRIYGPVRLPLLLQDWSILDSFGFEKADFTASFTLGHQPLFVLEPPKETSDAKPDAHSEL